MHSFLRVVRQYKIRSGLSQAQKGSRLMNNASFAQKIVTSGGLT
jgi:hypothetical protein